jgi:ribosomal protein L37E
MWCNICHYGSETFRPAQLEVSVAYEVVPDQFDNWQRRKVEKVHGICPRCGRVEFVKKCPFPEMPKAMGAGKPTKKTARKRRNRLKRLGVVDADN